MPEAFKTFFGQFFKAVARAGSSSERPFPKLTSFATQHQGFGFLVRFCVT